MLAARGRRRCTAEAESNCRTKPSIANVSSWMLPGLLNRARTRLSAFAAIDARMVELSTGNYVDSPAVEGFDPDAAASDPDLGVRIAAESDIASIRRRARFAPVYLVRSGDADRADHPAGLRVRSLVHSVRLPGARSGRQYHTRPALLPSRGNAWSGRPDR